MDNQGGILRVATIVGTRPEIIKCSPIIPLLDDLTDHTLIHTGQHYDDNMDARFFRELGLRAPDFQLGVGSGTQGRQLARMLEGIESALIREQPDIVVVQGDTNSTLAGALSAAKLHIPVAHIEAGCRSFNRAMPEEINRIVVDHLSTWCFAPDSIAADNLRAEGFGPDRVQVVGSTGIDACLRMQRIVRRESSPRRTFLKDRDFLVATIHRAENTTPERLPGLIAALGDLARHWPVVFPIHPRTAAALGNIEVPPGVMCIDPVGYRQMIELLTRCRGLLTDSGGLQEEAAILGAPTFVLRNETEWIAFVDAGHHILAGYRRERIVSLVLEYLDDDAREARMRTPIGHDRAGAAGRIVRTLIGNDTYTNRTKDGEVWKQLEQMESNLDSIQIAQHES